MTIFPYISIKPDRISLYSRSEFTSTRTPFQVYNEKNLINNDTKGKISKKASKRIKLAIDWLLVLADNKSFGRPKNGKFYNFKVNFITLTLCSEQVHSDKVIKSKLLNHFLVVAKQKWGVCNYVWRAEPQKRGAIHFHILTDKFIPWSELRATWNKIQEKLGYVSKFKSKFLHTNPNSTDIHSIKKVKNLSEYISKYCTKENGGRKIEGNQWGLSQGLSKLGSIIEIVDTKIQENVDKIRKIIKNRWVNYEYCSVMYVNIGNWWSGNTQVLDKILVAYLLPLRVSGVI
tara:strand:+ start:1233 stop:2096 length:864 start_codon:yes stop_codon:yes gene_type:complete